jgi:dTMP kinase
MIVDAGTKPAPAAGASRGAFILLEGVDRCGKTTQCALLLKHLFSLSMAAVALRFPDRTTQVGQLIDGYLQSGADLDDRAVHLLFSANRWEAAPNLAQTLAEGRTIVCDRYAYSGVAFSSAKTKEDRKDGTAAASGGSAAQDLGIDWCKSPDVGLPAPDCVLFLDLSQDEAEKRGG